MKICFWGKIANALLGKTYGGGELQIALLAKALTSLGHEVVVVDLDIEEGFVTNEGITVYPVKGYNSGMKMFRTITHRLPALYSTFVAIKADVYYCRIREYRHLIVYTAARKVKAKFMISLASDLDILSIGKRWKHFYSSNVKDLWGVFNGIMGEIVYPFLLRKADLVLVQHEGQKEILSRKGITTRVFYNLIDANGLKWIKNVDSASDFIYVGSLDKRKGFVDFVEIVKRTPMHKYKVIGKVRDKTGSTLYAQLEHFNNVQLMGKLSHSDTMNAISRSKALISTSPMEGFPNIFIEAWGCGVPVVSLYVDPGDVIKREGLGFVADGSLERMIEKMANISRSEEFSRNARSYVNAYHALTDVRMAEIKSIFDGMCG
jgi:glycosyltransferase involved in cell wall biosynthesis